MKVISIFGLMLVLLLSCQTISKLNIRDRVYSQDDLTPSDMTMMAKSLFNSFRSEKWVRNAKKAYVVYTYQVENKSEQEVDMILLSEKVKKTFSKEDKVFFTNNEDDSKYLLYGALKVRRKADSDQVNTYFSLTLFLRNRLTNRIKWSNEIEIEKSVEIKGKK